MSIALAPDGTGAPAPAPAALLPRRVRLSRAALDRLAALTGTLLPWLDDTAPSPLARALGDAPRTEPPASASNAERELHSLGLLDPTGAPVAEVAAALAVLAGAEVSVRLDLGVRRPATPQGVGRFTGWHLHGGDRITAISMIGGPELELAWFADAHWQRELAHLVAAPADPDGESPAPALTVPYELLLGSGAALRQQRPAVLADLLTRHRDRVLGPDGVPLAAAAAAEQVRLLHTAERGRLQVTVAGIIAGAAAGDRTLGLLTWALFPDGWRALLPLTVGGLPHVRVETVAPLTLGVLVARMVTGARS